MSIYPKNYYNKLLRLPFSLISVVTLISCFGFIVLWSAAGGNINPWAKKQIINFSIFLPIAVIIALTDIKLIFKFSYLFYFIILLLLIGVELFGTTAMGGKRWINLGFTRLQPSEPAKIALVMMLARYLHSIKYNDMLKTRRILLAISGVVIFVALIIKQPDLGTGIIALAVSIMIFFVAGIQIWKFALSGLVVLASLPIIWNMLYDYQRRRVLVFLDAERDPLGAGYNIIQSKIAIGSGGLFGKGLAQGTQSHLDFLPEHQTDFIFSTLAEEFGFLGCLGLLIMYMLIFFIGIIISINSKSVFGKLLVIGTLSILFSHVFINIAMVMGLLPAVGVPLPFISYGGTMMMSMLVGIGLIMNVAVHHNTNL